ncbi:MAG: hypothetical protein M0Q48_06640 [Verrucomicrobia bacterium]|nr:hypothetical protein [Verrucomicrobiota bacterium]
MKFIIKTTLLSGFTGAVWFMVFAFVGLAFNVYAPSLVAFPFYWILTVFIDTFYLDYDTITAMAIVSLPYFPGLIYGLIAGFLFSLFWSRTPEHKRKEYKFLSSLKHRIHPFLSYCLFLGEGSLCIVTLSLPLFILHLILTHIFHIGLFFFTVITSLIMLIMSALLSAVSAWLVRKCEVYSAVEHKRLSLSEGKEPENSPLLEEEQQIPLSVGVTMFLGGLEAVALALYMLVLMVPLLLIILKILVTVVLMFLDHPLVSDKV